jgi:hypothetical protein
MDIVVTVPKTFTHECAPGKRGLAAWIAEGDAAGETWSGTHWSFTVGGAEPNILIGERVYVVCEGRLRGYAPLVELSRDGYRWELIRGGGAVAITIPEAIKGFRGWRYRWWRRDEEIPFPRWKVSEGVAK